MTETFMVDGKARYVSEDDPMPVAITGSENETLTVTMESGNVFTLTFSTDTNAYASGDLVADTQELAGVMAENGGTRVLMSITLLDKADQKVALDFVFLDASQSLGTENSAPSISDSNGEKVLGHVAIGATDYVDLGGCAVATKQCAIELKAGAATTSLWVAIVNGTGTPTYAASDLIAKFGFLPS